MCWRCQHMSSTLYPSQFGLDEILFVPYTACKTHDSTERMRWQCKTPINMMKSRGDVFSARLTPGRPVKGCNWRDELLVRKNGWWTVRELRLLCWIRGLSALRYSSPTSIIVGW